MKTAQLMIGLRTFSVLFFVLFVACIAPASVYAQSCDPSCSDATQCADKIKKCQEAWNMMESAKKPHVENLRKMEADINAFQARLKTLEGDVAKKAVEIERGEKELMGLLDIAQARIRQFYINVSKYDTFSTFFGSSSVSDFIRVYGYQRRVTDDDKKSITLTAVSVKDLEDRRMKLVAEQASLAYIKTETDKRAQSIRKLVGEAESYQTKLTGIIASLSAQQQAILSARSGTFTTSLGDVPLADDPNASPNYNPGFSPAFAGFSFGAYTHKKGMSQYGAKGRAESGQNFKDILKAYYGKEPVGKDTGGQINVSGFGSMDFEGRYLLGIAEMPSNFPFEALKAQAIAARTYAWRYKQNGQAICTTQACQVYNNGKAGGPPEQWRKAVEETRGQIIEDVVTYYSSTTGGWVSSVGWDTKCGGRQCWTGDAYEKIANSPWFYKGWYTADYMNSSGKCGRSSPWLNGEEFADILNAWVVRKNGNDEDARRVLPVTINSCGISGASGNPYSMSEMRDRAAGMGGAYSSVSSVSVTYNTDGYTNEVIFQTNRGELRIPGGEFKETFNLRAPGYISIKSSLYNIEKK